MAASNIKGYRFKRHIEIYISNLSLFLSWSECARFLMMVEVRIEVFLTSNTPMCNEDGIHMPLGNLLIIMDLQEQIFIEIVLPGRF